MADSQTTPDVLQALLSPLKEALGTVFIGFCIGTTLYGVTVLQTYLYFKHYTEDKIFLKLVVSIFWMLDTLTTILVAHSIYTFLVLNLGDIEANLHIPWSFALENEIVDIITLMAQCYFGWQLFRLSRSKMILFAILSLAFAAFAIDIKVTVQIFLDPSLEALGDRSVYVFGSIVQGLSALCDILITVCLIYSLHGWRSGVKSTSIIVDKLILYAVTRGSLTATCQLMFMILNVAFPHNTYWQPFHQAVGKLYVNSVLASLNFRRTERAGTRAIPLRRTYGSSTIAQISFDNSLGPDLSIKSKMIFANANQTRDTSARSMEDGDQA